MSLSPGSLLELHPEKPVVGGRMLARVDGQVVLVSGTIPGERIIARLERRSQGVWFGATMDVLEASPDRCSAGPDPACGGMAFAHMTYARQCRLKAELVADAFARIARYPLGAQVSVTESPARGYRARYRVHGGEGMLGFYREGTRDVCDPEASNQLAGESLACLRALAARLPADAADVAAFECIENLSNTQRAVNLAMREGRRPSASLLAAVAGVPGVTGVSTTAHDARRVVAALGVAWVSDPIEAFQPAGRVPVSVVPGVATAGNIRRHAPAFFQANRFLAPLLAQKVVSLVGSGPTVDLYAGVGLFALCLAAIGYKQVTAIETDPISASDLAANAKSYGDRLDVVHTTVEEFLGSNPVSSSATLIVDPPRTGMSRAAMRRILTANASRLVYVSCDIATLARDTRVLLDGGYTLTHLEAFDLFPNTPHVEGVAVFDRVERRSAPVPR